MNTICVGDLVPGIHARPLDGKVIPSKRFRMVPKRPRNETEQNNKGPYAASSKTLAPKPTSKCDSYGFWNQSPSYSFTGIWCIVLASGSSDSWDQGAMGTAGSSLRVYQRNHKTEAICHIPLQSQKGIWTINPLKGHFVLEVRKSRVQAPKRRALIQSHRCDF